MWVIAVLLFATSFLAVYLLLGRMMGRRLALTDRLTYYAGASPEARRATGRWSDLPAADRVMDRLSLSRSLEHLLDQADLPVKPFEFILIIVVAMLALVLVGMLAGLAPGLQAPLATVGFLAALLWLRIRRARRRDAFNRQIPDALQAISNSLRAGFGFSQAMAVVASDLPPPISLEFGRAQREMNLGLTVEEVLQNMGRRIQSPDFDLTVSGILINRQIGGNLAELLDNITKTIRERVKLKNFIRVLTAEQRLSAVIVAAVPPLLLVILLLAWREYTRYLLITRIGQVMLVISILMQLAGAYFIRRVVSIDV